MRLYTELKIVWHGGSILLATRTFRLVARLRSEHMLSEV